MSGASIPIDQLRAASDRRRPLLERLGGEDTDCWRVFHGTTEGWPGVSIDRYGPLWLATLSRAADEGLDAARLAVDLSAALGLDDVPEQKLAVVDRRHGPGKVAVHGAESRDEVVCHEAGMRCLIRARHEGQDPWLFLDLRAGRRWLREHCEDRSVLNLFAYTGTAGLAAALAGAREALNVDFARSALDVSKRNAQLNGIGPDRLAHLREDCLAVTRQLAGMPVQRRGGRRRFQTVAPRRYDLVVLDPPRLAKSPFGKVDLVHDYPTVFKPAWLSVADGGALLATNNVASVDLDDWLGVLRRCAEKAGRPIAEIEVLRPDEDFPSPDGRPPLKLAVCRVAP